MASVSDSDDTLDEQESNYHEVRYLGDCGLFAECITAAKQNLTDPGLTPYWNISYLILIGLRAVKWDEAEKYRRRAERNWQAESRDAADLDEDAKRSLKELRDELDELQQTLAAKLQRYDFENDEDPECREGTFVQKSTFSPGAVVSEPEDIAATQTEQDDKEEVDVGSTAELGPEPPVQREQHANLESPDVACTAPSATSANEALSPISASPLASFEIF